MGVGPLSLRTGPWDPRVPVTASDVTRRTRVASVAHQGGTRSVSGSTVEAGHFGLSVLVHILPNGHCVSSYVNGGNSVPASRSVCLRRLYPSPTSESATEA